MYYFCRNVYILYIYDIVRIGIKTFILGTAYSYHDTEGFLFGIKY